MARPDPERFRKWGQLAGIGPTLVAAVVAGWLLGSWLDQRLGTTPWIMLAGVLLGTAGGFLELVRVLKDSGAVRKTKGKGGEDR